MQVDGDQAKAWLAKGATPTDTVGAADQGRRGGLIMAGEPRHLVVGRLRKPHGLKGEFTVFPLTNDPGDGVRARSRRCGGWTWPGTVLGEPVEIERSKAYHREWLVKFRGVESRDELERWKGQFLAAPAEELPPPKEGEVYLHELEGFAVRTNRWHGARVW